MVSLLRSLRGEFCYSQGFHTAHFVRNVHDELIERCNRAGIYKAGFARNLCFYCFEGAAGTLTSEYK
jgi:hypothetical protein